MPKAIPYSKSWINFLIEFVPQNQQPNLQNCLASLSISEYIKTVHSIFKYNWLFYGILFNIKSWEGFSLEPLRKNKDCL